MATSTMHHSEVCAYVYDDGLAPENYERREADILYVDDSDTLLVRAWCDYNGWTEMVINNDIRPIYWAYPPRGVMLEPIDINVVKQFFAEGKHLEFKVE